jgi:CubicO group peptidase (beta-lactamase class C family)
MKLSFSLILSLFFLFPCVNSFAQQINSDDSLATKLDGYLKSEVQSGQFNGSVLVACKGHIILHKGYGFKNYAAGTLNDANTIYPIGSLTKPFTAIVILKLQEEGKLSVTDKLSKYVPQQTGADQITIQNLLNHTSGIYDFSHDIPEDDSALLSHPIPQQKVLDAFIHRPLEFKPGSQYSYCNSDYFLLGMIIEKVTGQTYWQVVRQMIFTPLGMEHSGFDFINLKDTSKATGYKTFTADKHVLSVKWDSTLARAAGAIYSTIGDLYKWSLAIAQQKILSPASWQQAFTPALEKYGDGFWIDSLYGYKYVYHSGGLLGFMSSFRYYPDADVTVILQNNFGYYDQTLLDINNALSAIVFNKWKDKTSINVAAADLRQYVGDYDINGKDKVLITLKKDQLYIESTAKSGIPNTPLYPKGNDTFFLKEWDVELIFAKDLNNNVVEIISHENGKVLEYKKIK